MGTRDGGEGVGLPLTMKGMTLEQLTLPSCVLCNGNKKGFQGPFPAQIGCHSREGHFL